MRKLLLMLPSLLLLLVLALPLYASAEASPADLYISATFGDDANDGTLDAPLRTLPEALTRLRWNPMDDRVTVWLRGGTYTLEEPLLMTYFDRGNVTFASYPGETATITGVKPLTGWTETMFNGSCVFRAEYETMGTLRAVYGEDGLRQNARWPKEGYLYAAGPLKNTKDKFEQQQGFFAKQGDLPASLDGATLRLLHWWKDEISGVRLYDPLRGEVRTNRPLSMAVAQGDRYYLENVLTISMLPGEWAFDAAQGAVYYAPMDGETVENIALYAGALEQFIYINGVSGITFENITFERSGFSIPKNDLDSDFPQAAYDASAAVIVLNAQDIRFTGCTFRDMGSGCIQFGSFIKGAIVSGCTFEDIGAHAIYIHGENSRNENDVTESIVIENNEVNGYGRTFRNAAAILIIHARNVDINHNEIHGGTYTAISAGWVWGKGFSVTRGIRIQNNLLYNIGQRTLSDMGAIYLLGAQPGTVVAGNIIHDVSSHDYGGWGIYLDEGASQILVSNNLVYRCSAQGFHQHDGTGNTVRNNVFALNYDGQIGLSTAGSFDLDANVIVGTKPYIRSDGGTVRQGKNLFNSDTGIFVDVYGDNFAIADVRAALEVGFTPWVYNAGRTEAGAW